VFRAYDADGERLVAIKLFKLDLPPERVHQLVAEFESLIAAELNHPALAKPIAAGITGVAAYLAQDYVSAESLDLAVREYGPAPASDALRVAAQLAGALDFAAVVNVHHGALHPRDVLLSPEDTRLTGIGVAQALQKVGVTVPVRRPYTAPERLADPTITARADVFSLAAIMFELLTAKRIAGPGDPDADVCAGVAGADAAKLRAAFGRALAWTAAERFETALEFVDALKHAFPDVTLEQSAVSSRQSAVEKKKPRRAAPKPDDSRLPIDASRPTADSRPPTAPELTLPLDEPELTDRADIEVPIVAAPAVDEPLLREPEVPDLPLAQAEEERFTGADIGVSAAPPTAGAAEDAGDQKYNLVTSAPGAVRPEVFSTAIEQSRSAVWPLILALGVGIAVGFAAGYGMGSHDRPAPVEQSAVNSRQSAVEPPQAPAGKEFTESAVPAPATASREPRPPNPESRTPNPEHPVTVNPGRLLVRSTPSGARVTVDGKDAGVTPATIRDLASGAHRVHVAHDGYTAVERRVAITRAHPAQSITVPLERERAKPSTPASLGQFAGTLSIESRPAGAKVYLDGKLIGTTPLARPSVQAGEHAVRLEYDGYHRWTSSVRIVAGEQNRVTASLER
jgi:serine/threonine protein kinase